MRPFLFQVLEKAAKQLTAHINKHGLISRFQFGCRQGHSTEAAIMNIVNDFLVLMTTAKWLLSSSYIYRRHFTPTADHEILLSCLEINIDVEDTAQSRFRSYLSGLCQVVPCASKLSCSHTVTSGVPQDRSLDPYSSHYTRPLEQVVMRHTFNYRFYAHDTQIYLSFDTSEDHSAVSRLNYCLSDIRN